MPKLVSKDIEAVPAPPAGQTKVWDSEVKGFGAVVTAGGARTWIVRYRSPAGGMRQMKLGRLAVLTADQARTAARRVLVEVAGGRDPLEQRRQARRAPKPAAPLTVAGFADRFIEDHVSRKKSGAEDRRKLSEIIIPAIGHLELAAVGTGDVQALHSELGKDRPILANRTRALLSSFFQHAERLDLRPPGTNPCRFVKKFPERSRERFLSESELARFAEGLAGAVEERPARAIGAAAIRLLALTGCRRNEILERTWDDYDPARGVLRLRDSKTGPRDVRLGAPAIQLLEGLPRTSEWIFPSIRGFGRITDIRKLIERACELADPPVKPFRPHDLRHSFASLNVKSGLNLQLVGSLLGHARVTTTERYSHLADDHLQRAAEVAQGAVARAMDGSGEGGDVLPFPGGNRPQ